MNLQFQHSTAFCYTITSFLILVNLAEAAKINVPADQPTIQAGKGTFVVLERTRFERGAGRPKTETLKFDVFNPNTEFTIYLENGNGETGADRVTSAVVRVNGMTVLRPNDFNKRVEALSSAVTLELHNEFSVEVRGRPGSFFHIEIIGVDDEPPTITGIIEPAPNEFGWNNSPVTVSFQCTDAISGIAECTGPVIVDAEGAGQVVIGTAVDNASLTTDTAVTVNLDTTAPTIDIVGQDTLDGVTDFHGIAADALSGIADVFCDDFSVAVAEDGSFMCTLVTGTFAEVTVRDRAGNVTTLQLDEFSGFEPALELLYIEDFEKVWDTVGVPNPEGIIPGTVWRPIVPEGYHVLHHLFEPRAAVQRVDKDAAPAGFVFAARELEPGALAEPEGYFQRWNDQGSGADASVVLWEPICPDGYVGLGHFAGGLEPSEEKVKCVREANVEPFTPYDLRRSMATDTRATLGKEAAKVLLGHAKTDTTEIYLLEEVQEAMKVAKLLASKNTSPYGHTA
jgi:hypothetical protein